MDTLTKIQRSFNMARIRSFNTSIEKKFRSLLYKNGFRNYKINANIPGKPDIYFPKEKIAVFIDGCFWHRCKKCFNEPKSNTEYWRKKIDRNVKNRKKIRKKLKENGIILISFWEHEIKKDLLNCLKKFKNFYEKQIKNS